jgi:hypothetical protein
MLHACVQRFDVTGNLKILANFLASKRHLDYYYMVLKHGEVRIVEQRDGPVK